MTNELWSPYPHGRIGGPQTEREVYEQRHAMAKIAKLEHDHPQIAQYRRWLTQSEFAEKIATSLAFVPDGF